MGTLIPLKELAQVARMAMAARARLGRSIVVEAERALTLTVARALKEVRRRRRLQAGQAPTAEKAEATAAVARLISLFSPLLIHLRSRRAAAVVADTLAVEVVE